ncbi:MAG TPA: response regulator [Burkholderiaceae bacterium]|nr:response regulator [Burkholderiaceae bacterium]
MKLLLTEDDPLIGDGLVLALGDAGFQVDWVRRADQSLTALEHTPYNLWVLDLGLPDRDGLDLLARTQAGAHRPPTLILSARAFTTDRVRGLNLGADDYLAKPFDLDELIARLHALHRRNQGRRDPLLRVNGLEVDPVRQHARLHEQALDLSRREFALLLALAEDPQAVRSVPWLENRLYGWGQEVASNSVQVHLANLRRKLGPGWIENLRGQGYRLQAT